jgi:hypothetical protein
LRPAILISAPTTLATTLAGYFSNRSGNHGKPDCPRPHSFGALVPSERGPRTGHPKLFHHGNSSWVCREHGSQGRQSHSGTLVPEAKMPLQGQWSADGFKGSPTVGRRIGQLVPLAATSSHHDDPHGRSYCDVSWSSAAGRTRLGAKRPSELVEIVACDGLVGSARKPEETQLTHPSCTQAAPNSSKRPPKRAGWQQLSGSLIRRGTQEEKGHVLSLPAKLRTRH